MPTSNRKIAIKDAAVFTRQGLVKQTLYIEEGLIAPTPDFFSEEIQVVEGKNLILAPGFVDLHVHLREPGFSYKETIKSGTQAAAAGGFTTVCAMPNLSPAPDSLPHLAMEQQLIDAQAVIEVLPYATVSLEEKGEVLSPISQLAPYCIGFSDDGKGVQSHRLTIEAMKQIKQSDSFFAAHCEDEQYLVKGGSVHEGKAAERFQVPGISAKSEWSMIARDLSFVRETGVAYHVCHISTKEGVALLRQAKAEGLPVSCECTPHQLAFSQKDITHDDGRFKMNPPLREEEDRQAIIEGLLDGTIDCIATDHAPHGEKEKSQGLAHSAFGIVGLETAFAACYTALVQKGLCSLPFLLHKLTYAPADLIRKTIDLLPGNPANFTLIDPDAFWQVNPTHFLSKGRSSPFSGHTLQGDIVATFYQGFPVYQKNSTQTKEIFHG
ncbi:MAG: dihydroorotase [Clostridiales bacterium]|nr:dihydroorotase [Clostridiales bacterium]